MAKKSHKTDKSQRRRILFLMGFLGVFCFMTVFARLVWMQVFRYDFYLEKAAVFAFAFKNMDKLGENKRKESRSPGEINVF